MNVIELSGISKTYCNGHIAVPAVRRVDLTVTAGEFLAVMGHSGSGKSTLLNILGLLDRPTSGTYRLCERDVSVLPDAEMARIRNARIGFVFQKYNLLPRLTALENVMLPMVYSGAVDRRAGRTRALALLERVGIADRANHRPNEMSGGQQQRVAIARALINDPAIILADEPTGNLDSVTAAGIIALLTELNDGGITIVMVTHEQDLAQVARRVIVMHDGSVQREDTRLPAVASGVSLAGRYPPARRPLTAMVGEYFTQAFRSLVANKTRSLLSVLGVLIGVASVIAMLSLGTGAQRDVQQRIAALGSNLLSVRPQAPRVGGVAMNTGAQVRLSEQDVAEIAQIEGVAGVAAYTSGRGQALYGGKNWNTRVEGVSPSFFPVRGIVPAAGRTFDGHEARVRSCVALVGRTVVRELFGDRSPVGEYLRINRIQFQVIGVMPVRGSQGWRDEDDVIIIPLQTAMYRVFGRDTVDYLDVQVSQETLMDPVSVRIQRLIAALRRLPATRGNVVEIRNLADIQQTAAATTQTFSFLLGGIALISLLVGGIGIMNIMLVSVTERTREIGLRKSLGADRNDILAQFLIESVAVCLLGGLLGISLGTAVSVAMSRLAGWSTVMTPGAVVLAFCFSVLIGVVFGLWPARRASGLDPIEALRYE